MNGIQLVIRKVIELAGTRLVFGAFAFTIMQMWLGLFALSLIFFFIRKLFLDD